MVMRMTVVRVKFSVGRADDNRGKCELSVCVIHLWYCAWRNWNSSLMRSSDSGMVNLKGWPGAWWGVWRVRARANTHTHTHRDGLPTSHWYITYTLLVTLWIWYFSAQIQYQQLRNISRYLKKKKQTQKAKTQYNQSHCRAQLVRGLSLI